MWRASFRIGLFLTVCVAATANAQIAHFVAQSGAGDPVGQGQNWDLTFTPNTSFQFSAVGTETLDNQPSDLQFNFTSSDFSKQLSLSFLSDGLEAPLTVGTYDNAVFLAPVIAGHPGMAITIDGHQPQTLTGSFTITDLSYHFDSGSGLWQVDKFGASFVQFADGSNAPLTGTFTFDAHASAVPEPASISAVALGCLALARKRKRK